MHGTGSQSDVEFFLENAGFAYNPRTQTPEEGKLEGAKSLAEAEAWAIQEGITFEWEDDWSVGDHSAHYGYAFNPVRCEIVTVRLNGEVIDVLGCVDDADANYRRVVEAELAHGNAVSLTL